jgi:hypothetical protein
VSVVVPPTGSVSTTRWVFAPPVVPADLILRLQKYRRPAEVHGPIRDAAEAMAAEAGRLTAPEAAVWRGPVTGIAPDGDVVLDGVHRFKSRALARLLDHAEAAYVVAFTLGDALERRVDALFEERCLLEGLFLDTAGWAAIELLMRGLRRLLLAEERPAGRVVTHRVAPGYQDWPVDEQAALLRVFGGMPIPVRVTEFAWMLPRKSVSAVFGVCPTPPPQRKDEP